MNIRRVDEAVTERLRAFETSTVFFFLFLSDAHSAKFISINIGETTLEKTESDFLSKYWQ